MLLLPMLLQFPFFIGFYKVLNVATELRGTSSLLDQAGEAESQGERPHQVRHLVVLGRRGGGKVDIDGPLGVRDGLASLRRD